MAATFNTTENTGWSRARTTSSSTAAITLTPATDLASGVLALNFFVQDGTGAGTTFYIGSESLTQLDYTQGTGLSAYCAWFQEDGTPPASWSVNDSNNDNEIEAVSQICITGHNTSTPIKEFVTPNTGSDDSPICPASTQVATSNDLYFRVIFWDSDKTLTGGPATELFNWPQTATSFGVGHYVAYGTGSGSTLSATSAATLSGAIGWIAYTVIVAGAAGGNVSIEVPTGPLR